MYLDWVRVYLECTWTGFKYTWSVLGLGLSILGVYLDWVRVYLECTCIGFDFWSVLALGPSILEVYLGLGGSLGDSSKAHWVTNQAKRLPGS